MKRLMVTGGAGFIGSNFVHYMLKQHPDYKVLVYDKLTYAGNLDNLADVADDPRYAFVQGDICNAEIVREAIQRHKIDTLVNFAAETHVDRSLTDPGSFIMTDVYGTFVLLEAAKDLGLERYHQVSTDEVYGKYLIEENKAGITISYSRRERKINQITLETKEESEIKDWICKDAIR